MRSQRSVQAKFKSGTLKSFFKIASDKSLIEMAHLRIPNTYKHSVNGSKSSGWHVTRVSMDIKKENLIFEILSNAAPFY